MRTIRRNVQGKDGFALVITVILLALLLLVLVSTATLTHIETSIGFNSRREAQAKQNAFYALNRALGELQRHAGPDQRVTASGEFDASAPTDGRRFWTGVWAPSGLQTWLVNGNEDAAPTATPTVNPSVSVSSGITLVGANTVGAGNVGALGIKVNPTPITSDSMPGVTGEVTVGNYAWWVGDEGVKARVNLTDSYSASAADSPEGKMRHQTTQRIAGEQITGLASVSANHENLPRLLMENQLGFFGVTFENIRARFHDITVSSIGLLSDTRSGGLKFDLTPFLIHGEDAANAASRLPRASTGEFNGADIDGAGANLSTFGLLRSWWELTAGTPGTSQAFGPYVDSSNIEKPGIAPVVVQCSLFFGVTRDAVDSHLRCHIVPAVSLWNPYNRPLIPTDLTVTVAFPGLMQYSVGGTQALNTIRLFVAASAWGGALPEGETRLFSVSNAETNPLWAPLGTSGNLLASGWRPGNAFFLTNVSTNPVGSGTQLVASSISGSAATLALYLGDNIDPSNLLQSVSSLGIYNGQTPTVNVENRTSTSVSPPGNLKTYPEMNAQGWFIGPFNSGRFQRINYENGRGALGEFTLLPPSWIPTSGFAGFSVWNPTGVPGWLAPVVKPGQTRATLFELPDPELPVVSIADLQHIVPRRPSEVGLSYLFPQNNTLEPVLWDGFYFSTIPNNYALESTGDRYPALPNGRYQVISRNGVLPPISDLKFDPVSPSNPMETVAANLVVKGAFNVNSTSVEAWKAVLSGFRNVPVANTEGQTEVSGMIHPFSRYSKPRSAGANTLVSSPDDPVDEPELWTGYRRLTDAQITKFAMRVADFVKTKGVATGPFLSLGEFATSAALVPPLGPAADDVNPPSIAALPNGTSVPAAADVPGLLTRSDILSVLGPILSARSDTFRIRTYGESTNPVTGAVESRAWCEAIVQRMPDFVDSTQPAATAPASLNATNLKFGRRFQIVQFRWLSPADI